MKAKTQYPSQVFMQKIWDAKAQRRKELAQLSFEEKIKILVEMQKMAAPILALRGIKKPIWEL